MGILDKFSMAGKTAIVTGSAGGLGKAAATALAEAGANVVIADIDSEQAQKTAAEIAEATGASTISIEVDVSKSDLVNAMVEQTVETFGRLDVLFNNAGIATVGPAEDISEEDFDHMIDVNLKGVFLGTQAAGRVMLKQGSGSIINMASMSAHISNLPQLVSHYAASKAGVLQLSRNIAAEWADRGVRVNVISPGYHRTEMADQFKELQTDWWIPRIPMGRLAEVEELGGVVVFLASDASSYMTGSELVTDGGYLLW